MKTAAKDNLNAAAPATHVDLARLFIDAFPALDAGGRRLALALYRLLARGRPVSPSNLANATGFNIDQVRDTLGDWPGVFHDDEGNIVGFWGIAVGSMTHRLDIDGNAAYAWCAWDTLFLPQLLDATVSVSSRCAQTGATVRLRVSPSRVESVEPRSVVISFLQPDERDLRERATTSFCHFVHFFADPEAGCRWIALHPGTFLLPVEAAFDLGRRVNAARYADSLSTKGDPS